MTLRDDDLRQFVARLRARLEIGARQYGDASFRRPLIEIIGEIQDELVDVAGWGLIAWVRLERLRARVNAVANGGTDGS